MDSVCAVMAFSGMFATLKWNKCHHPMIAPTGKLIKPTWQYELSGISVCLDWFSATSYITALLLILELIGRNWLWRNNKIILSNILTQAFYLFFSPIFLLRKSSAFGMASSNWWRLIIGLFSSRKNNFTTPVKLWGSLCSCSNL